MYIDFIRVSEKKKDFGFIFNRKLFCQKIVYVDSKLCIYSDLILVLYIDQNV